MNTHPIYQKLLENIRAWRLKRGLSQNEMAKLIGIKQSNYAKFENNQLDIKVSALLRLLDLTEINQEELLKKFDGWQEQITLNRDVPEADIKLLVSVLRELLSLENKK